jgi:hypothetical protein
MRVVIGATANLGLERCTRCGEWIEQGEAWDLDHTEDRTEYRGASHAKCNRARK